jgi:enoyl-CoA hydratase/carnithine racemase
MIVDEQKLERKPAADLGRRDVLALAGAAAAVGLAEGPALAQSQPAAAATATTQPQTQTKPTVVFDRPVKGVLLIGIDRIDAQNRIDISTFSAIGQAYYQFDHDDDLKVAVLHGKGPDFSKGLDQASWGAALRNGPFQTPQNFIDPVATAGPERSKPLVVAVQGHVTRVAHELFLAADLRIAAQDAIFNQGEVTAASFPGGGATVRFVREAGWGNAMRYMLTGDHWSAEESYRIGITQQIAATPGAALEAGIAIARKIAACGPLSIKATLTSAHQYVDPVEADALSKLGAQYAALYRTEDFLEGRRAEAEGRPPKYQGK